MENQPPFTGILNNDSKFNSVLAGNIEDLILHSERYIFNFSSKDELKNWHLYSDSEYGGFQSLMLHRVLSGGGFSS
ncbi:hypothetical protein BC332_14798 [Capsicum chinense]|nr:hypothetical protein BC332_14798 [Capsicum chinense]